MSEALFSRLPRFDQAQPPPAAPEPAEAPAPPPPDYSAIDAVVAELAETVAGVRRHAESLAVETAQALSAKLFPALSDLFLADEIGRHLPVLVPDAAPDIEIRAEAGLAEKIEAAIARSDGLAARCAVRPAARSEESRVHVSWKTGGVTFDFDGLLAASLARLQSDQDNKGEGDHG